MDPQQRLLLEVVREALEDAGEIDTSGRNIGCYVGTFGEDWVEMYAKESQNYGPYRPTAAGDYSEKHHSLFTTAVADDSSDAEQDQHRPRHPRT